MINSFKQYLQLKLEKGLPGKTAHIEVAPYRKVDFSDNDIVNAKKSGVLILFYLKEGEIYTVLIQRHKYDGKHSGQISFPGGKYEETDEDISYTALREANEEVGIVKDDVEIIGQISNVFIPISNFYVSPVLGFIDYYPEFDIDNYEVEGLIELKLADLIATKELKESKITLSNNTFLKVPSFIIDNKIVWGATALILNELRHILFKWE
jgi:8-oxo-dGTP pyrophosphatase MutT (NUDIX family)